MTGVYCKELDSVSRNRYIEKLCFQGETLPDPLDTEVRDHIYKSSNFQDYPSVTFGDIYIYLVVQKCFYTNQCFKSYKSLEGYNFLISGKVSKILVYKCKALKVCVLTFMVLASQTLDKFYQPWVVVESTGCIQSGHCACMAGLGEACGHIAALLFTIEVCIKEGLNNPSSASLLCSWKKIVKKVDPVPVTKLNFSHKRKKATKTSSSNVGGMPSKASYEELLNIVRENVPNAPILSVLTDSEDTDTASEGEEEANSFIKYINNLLKNIPHNYDIKNFAESIIRMMKMTEEEIAAIEIQTRGQPDCELWYVQRKGRLTASLFGRIIHCRGGVLRTQFRKK